MAHEGEKNLSNKPEKGVALPVRISMHILDGLVIGLHIYRLEDRTDDSSLRMIYANEITEEFTGIPPGEVIGKTLDQSFPGLRDKGVPQIYARVARTGEPADLGEIAYGNRRINPAWFKVQVSPLPDNCVAVSFTNITERKREEKEKERFLHDLGERNKELDLLYQVSRLSTNPNLSLEDILSRTVHLIPSSWQYPRIACARIVLGEHEFRSENFRETEWRQTSVIECQKGSCGLVEVCYLEEKPRMDEGPFLKEERDLIDALALLLANISDQIMTRRKLERHLKGEMVLARISSRFVAASDLDWAVERALEDIGHLSGASRGCLFLFRDTEVMENTHEWCALGVEPEKEKIQDLPIDAFPWVTERIRSGKAIHIADPSEIPSEGRKEMEIMESQDICSLLVLPVRIEGKVAGFVGFDDITETGNWNQKDIGTLSTAANIIGSGIEHKRAQKQIERYSEHLEKLVEERTMQLKEKERMAAIGETSAMVGHDLRNPLQAVVNNLYLIRKEIRHSELNRERRSKILEFLENIVRETGYMDKIVSDIQDYSRTLKPEIQPVDLLEVMEEILSDTYLPEDVKVSVNIEIGEGELRADRGMLKRILTNLVTNAVQSMPEEGDLAIRACREDGNAIIEVKDTGAGIPREQMEKVFEPLFTTKAQGQGFGLAVCKRLAEAQAGTISVKSKEGEGTTVTLVLPADGSDN